MKKFNCNNPILLDKFKEHHLYKDRLLKYFDEYNLAKNNFESDNITKFDWHISTDFNREWVKMIYDDLHKHFLKYAILTIFGFNNMIKTLHINGTFTEIIIQVFIM